MNLALARPAARWLDVFTTLADFAIVTFDVAPEQLEALLPPGFEPEVFTLDDGRRRAFVSAVPFRDLDFRFHRMPWLRFAFPQVNYRAYVRRGEERVAWFFGTTLDTIWVTVPRVVWQLPWRRVQSRSRATWRGEVLEDYALDNAGPWGAATLRLSGTPEPAGRLDGFTDEDETALVLTHPLVGWMHRLDGRLTTYSVWHERLVMQRAHVHEARFAVFETLGLVEAGQAPHSVLVQKSTEFHIRLPPESPETTSSPRTGHPGESGLSQSAGLGVVDARVPAEERHLARDVLGVQAIRE